MNEEEVQRHVQDVLEALVKSGRFVEAVPHSQIYPAPLIERPIEARSRPQSSHGSSQIPLLQMATPNTGRGRGSRRQSRRGRQQGRNAALPQNVTRSDYWAWTRIPSNPPTLSLAGPIRKRVSFGVTISSQTWIPIRAESLFIEAFATDVYKRVLIDNVSVWTDSVSASHFMWVQLKGEPPIDSPSASAQQIFAHTARGIAQRASTGYHVPDIIAGPYDKQAVFCHAHTNATTIICVVSATFMK